MIQSKDLRQSRQNGSKNGSKILKLLHSKKAIDFLNGLVCLLIPTIFFGALIFMLTACTTAVTVKNPIEVPDIPYERINEYKELYIDAPLTESDLMQNIYVLEGLLYTYMDYTDSLVYYIDTVSASSYKE